MNAMESTLTSSLALPGTRARTPRSARVVLALLEKLEHGTLELRLPDGSQHRFGEAALADATLDVGDWSMFDSVLERGDVGFAESWIAGDWHSPDLGALLTLLANNRERLAQAVYGQWWGLLTDACVTGSTPTRAPDHAATSWRTTTSATTSTGNGSTRR